MKVEAGISLSSKENATGPPACLLVRGRDTSELRVARKLNDILKAKQEREEPAQRVKERVGLSGFEGVVYLFFGFHVQNVFRLSQQL